MSNGDAATLGIGFVWEWKDGVTRGYGEYVGFPIRLRLEPWAQDGKVGHRVTILSAPPPKQESTDAP